MNLILVPALLLLIGLVIYKKVVAPKRGGAGKAEKPAKPGKAPKEKARPATSSGRMGSVL